MLRRLRAAEMAAWEDVRPNTAVDQGPPRTSDGPMPHESRKRLELPVGLILLGAASGSVVLSLDLLDASLLFTGWSQLLTGIRSLFA